MSQNGETQIPDKLPVTELTKHELAQNKQHLPHCLQKSLFSIHSIVVCVQLFFCIFSLLPTLGTKIDLYSLLNMC